MAKVDKVIGRVSSQFKTSAICRAVHRVCDSDDSILQLGKGLWLLAAPEMSSLSEYALRMTRLSARLFGEVARPTDSKSMKVVKLFSEQPLAKRKETYDWYPDHNTYFALMGTLRFLGLYRDEHQDFKDEQMRLKKLRGKGKPRKGEGKRATKKK
ncbi:28S ribosomal protein S33, mitochondrial [Pteropus alecto]|uniref:Small ribosomal subunit protein mS33 n=2 Tax=Pteropus TaxID=9401 RepID=L5KS67_PTEAL|nr:28S ribosomal protein S33, mitochondrial [Pteropus alecto]